MWSDSIQSGLAKCLISLNFIIAIDVDFTGSTDERKKHTRPNDYYLHSIANWSQSCNTMTSADGESYAVNWFSTTQTWRVIHTTPSGFFFFCLFDAYFLSVSMEACACFIFNGVSSNFCASTVNRIFDSWQSELIEWFQSSPQFQNDCSNWFH